MSYNFLVNATKNRIITELKDAFASHPIYKDLEVLNKFPMEERIQEGIIIRNSSAGRMPLSADNFQGTVCSFTTVAKHSGSKSLSVEWVREDSSHLSEWISREDFSFQFTNFPQENTSILLNEKFVKGRTNLDLATNYKAVEVYVNNERVIPLVVDGANQTITLSEAPMGNSKVEVSYWTRNLAAAGVYQLEVTGGDPTIHEFEFMLDGLLDKSQTLIEKAEGNETSVRLAHYPVWPCSLKLRENGNLLTENEDYVVDLVTGIITFLQNPTFLRNSKIITKVLKSIKEYMLKVILFSLGIFKNHEIPLIIKVTIDIHRKNLKCSI